MDKENTFEFAVVEEINVAHCCRACMQTNCALIPIDSVDEDAVVYHDKLTYCMADIEWYQEGLSTLICEQCIPNLRVAYDFRKSCIATDETFKRCLLLQNDESRNELCDNELCNDDAEPSTDKFETCEVGRIPVLEEKTNNEEDLNQNVNMTCYENGSENETIEKEDLRSSSLQQATLDVFVEKSDLIDDNFKEQHTNSTINIRKTSQTNSFGKRETSEKENVSLKAEQIKDPLVLDFPETIHDQTIEDAEFDAVSEMLTSEIVLSASSRDSKNSLLADNEQVNGFKNVKDLKSPVGPKIPKVHECEACGKVYSKNATLKIHQRTHTGEKPFECQYCEKRFHHSSHRKEHERRHTNEKRYLCEICNKRFIIRGELNMHMKSHTGEKNYHCSKCDRRCLTATDLKIHLRTHTGEKPYPCETCGRHFASTYILSVHMKTHTGVRPYTCKICDKKFTQNSHLKVHMHVHTGEKFPCRFCSELFPHRSQLAAHIAKNHDDQVKTHRCTECDKTFRFPKDYKVHMARHKGEKYPCKICGKQFHSPWYLTEHSRIHTGNNLHSCAICNKSFTRKVYLKKHVRTHTGEKPYSCETCGKNFTNQSNYKTHLRIHTGERPHACTLCQKKYNRKSELTIHLQKCTERQLE